MAEKAEKKDAAPEKGGDKGGEHGGEAKKGGGGLFTKTPVLLGVAMVLEAIVLFAGFKFLGGGAKQAAGAEVTPASAEDGHGESKSDEHGSGHGEEKKADAHGGGESHGEGGDGHGDAKPATPKDKKRKVELPVADFRAPNKQSGRTFLYDVSIFISVRADAEDKAKAILTDRAATIKDRIRTIIAQSDPEKLGGGSEPGLETLRRQIKYQLDEMIGDGVIDEVLVPRCIPFPVNF